MDSSQCQHSGSKRSAACKNEDSTGYILLQGKARLIFSVFTTVTYTCVLNISLRRQ
jgi:hypothetical protein